MSDIRTIWYPETAIGDWESSYGDLVTGDDLETSILISLFTDRLANADDSIDGDDRRGWWGDSGEDYNIGSRLWLLSRKQLNKQTAMNAETYAKEALQWLIDDGVVSSVSVSSLIVYPRQLFLSITYQQPGKDSTDMNFSWVWESANAI